MEYTFTLDLRVQDEETLFAAAWAHAIVADKLAPQQAEDLLKPGGEISHGACLIMLLDPGSLPGCKVHQSTVT